MNRFLLPRAETDVAAITAHIGRFNPAAAVSLIDALRARWHLLGDDSPFRHGAR